MKINVVQLDNKKAGDIELDETVFGLPERKDVLHRVVRWQLAKRRSGNHKTLGRSEIARTGAKFVRQKGSGGARHGSKRTNIFRGGAVVHGPVVRDHGFALPKKIRSLGLKTALSVKAAAGDLVVLDNADLDSPKTKALLEKFDKLGLKSALIIDGEAVNENFALAAANIPMIDVLPHIGANVYDILRRDKLVLTKAAVEALEARLK